MIYETKGLSLEQVDKLYGIISQARKSKRFTPQLSYAEVDHEKQRHMSLSEITQSQERKRSVQHDEGLPAKV